MVVVVVLGLSFAGYVATRRLGSGKGIMINALCGSLVSSTAVTVTYEQRLRQKDGPEAPLIAGIALESLVMFVRVQLMRSEERRVGTECVRTCSSRWSTDR